MKQSFIDDDRRMENELKVYCARWSGYLYSTDCFTANRDNDFTVECPKWQGNRCGYGPPKR